MSDPINMKFPMTKGSQGAFEVNEDTISAVTDDLKMGGAGSVENIEQNSIKALKAGHNLLMISGDLDLQRRAIYAIRERYEKDVEFKKLVEQNRDRIESFKKQKNIS